MYKLALLSCASALAIVASPAAAVPLFFDFVGTDPMQSVSFTLDSNPVPDSYDLSGGLFDDVLTNTRDGAIPISIFFFYSAGGGGFSAFQGGTFYASTTTAVPIPTGFIEAPVFAPGVYVQNPFSATYLGGILTISAATPAVPEPATWAMMIAGLGIVGASMRRRRANIAFA